MIIIKHIGFLILSLLTSLIEVFIFTLLFVFGIDGVITDIFSVNIQDLLFVAYLLLFLVLNILFSIRHIRNNKHRVFFTIHIPVTICATVFLFSCITSFYR